MGTRCHILTVPAGERLVTETCYSCGVLFAMAENFFDHRQADKGWFYCPNGHRQCYTGKTASQKLEEAKAREVALQDQLRAATRDAENSRMQLMRDRSRIAKGVCPCCNRYFEAVRRHMESEHPDYNAPDLRSAPAFKCSCGRVFKSFQGLRTHQGWARPDDWDSPGKSTYWAHLTVVTA